MLTEEQLQRYGRQVQIEGFGPAAQEKLLTAKVLVIGAGGLGSTASLYLAAAGVGTIGIADYDVVELSNLQRQIVHCEESLGCPKTESAFRSLHRLNSAVIVEKHQVKITSENGSDLIRNYDFIIEATDTLSSKFVINAVCVENLKPFCHAGVKEFGGQIMTIIPYQSACLACVVEEFSGDEQRRGENAVSTCTGRVGIVGAVAGFFGALQALEAIKWITGTASLLSNSIFSMDAATAQVRKFSIARNPSCPRCGILRSDKKC
ncbi:MAG: HesA/MoeB/ThiF family protein [Chitinivibrionales bacterium]|nr:HesA/MoeB/ThiF family protein [Chitinivibrionales bacterium]